MIVGAPLSGEKHRRVGDVMSQGSMRYFHQPVRVRINIEIECAETTQGIIEPEPGHRDTPTSFHPGSVHALQDILRLPGAAYRQEQITVFSPHPHRVFEDATVAVVIGNCGKQGWLMEYQTAQTYGVGKIIVQMAGDCSTSSVAHDHCLAVCLQCVYDKFDGAADTLIQGNDLAILIRYLQSE